MLQLEMIKATPNSIPSENVNGDRKSKNGGEKNMAATPICSGGRGREDFHMKGARMLVRNFAKNP